MNNKEELKALATYLAKHNESHTDELSGLLDQLADRPEATAKITEAIEEYKKGNALLEEALKYLD